MCEREMRERERVGVESWKLSSSIWREEKRIGGKMSQVNFDLLPILPARILNSSLPLDSSSVNFYWVIMKVKEIKYVQRQYIQTIERTVGKLSL